MHSRCLDWMVAGGLAGWAAARLAAADRMALGQAWTVPVLAFTPQAAAAAWAGALLARHRGASATAALAGAAMTAVLAPRAVRRRQPDARGPVLRVLTVNLRAGLAAAGMLVELARRLDADMVFLQELADEAVPRLGKAGLGDLLPNRVTHPGAEGLLANGIYARYPLTAGLSAGAGSAGPGVPGQCAARLDLPSGHRVQLVSVHLPPPRPPWRPIAVARWRREMARLPPPGDLPMIMAGDFNATLDHAQFRRLLRRGYLDAARQAGRGLIPTWGPEPYGRPALLTIDHVLADRRCAVRATSAHRLAGSDHHALHAELRLPG